MLSVFLRRGFRMVDRPIQPLRGFLRRVVGNPFAAPMIAILGFWALFLHTRAVLANRVLWLTLAVIAINLLVSIIICLHHSFVLSRYLAGVRMATLLAFALVIAEILSDRRAQALLIATAAALFVSFVSHSDAEVQLARAGCLRRRAHKLRSA